MKNYLLNIIFLLVSFQSYGSHIVGGDFKITMTSNTGSGANYIFQLRLYKDEINASISANLPTSATIGIYDVQTHNLISTQTLNRTNIGFVTLGDACYSPNPNVVRIEEGIYSNSVPKFLFNNSNGYYIQYQAFARNGIIANMQNPNSTGITIFAMLPDPSIGQNSSPDFGVYPPDAYFCANNTKLMNFPALDPDGDSLVYTLVDPLNSSGNLNGTSAGSGTYPFYPACQWAGGYSINDIVGGNPPMAIDPASGLISATPSIIGYFVFTVRVEEFRNGIKLGEVRRDVQYASLPCTVPPPPSLSVNGYQGTFPNYSLQLDVNVNDTVCFDVDANITDVNDSIYIQLSSSNFNLLTHYQSPTTIAGNSVSYTNWENTPGNNISFNPNNIINGFYGNLSSVYLRYCWSPSCLEIDSTFTIDFDIYSVDVDNSDCAGVTPSQASLDILVNVDSTDSSSFSTKIDTFCVNYVLNGQTYTSPGTYTQQLTNSQGCDSTIILELTQSNMTLNLQKTDESCTSGNGSIFTSVLGGNAPYSFSLNGGPSTSNNSFNNLSAGNYTVDVIDNSGCTASEVISLFNLAGPAIDSVIFQNPSCSDSLNGTIAIYGSTGVILQYSIDSGYTYQNSNSFSNLSDGNYHIFISDGLCTVSYPVINLTIPQAINIKYTTQVNCPPCSCNTVVDVSNTTGGSGILTYSVDNGNTNQTSPYFFNVCAGNYTILVTDQQGCIKTKAFSIQSLPTINLNVTSTNPTCFGSSDGSVGFNISGGSGSPLVSLNGAQPSLITQYNNLSSGNYNFIVSDSCGCSVDTTISLTDPTQVQIDTILITDEICFGDCLGQINVNSSTANSYFLSTNQALINYSSNFDSLCAGTYTVYALNTIGCLDSATVDILSPSDLTFSNFSTDTTVCIGGTITSQANILGGTGNIDYFWSDGSTGSLSNWMTNSDTSIYVYGVDDVGCYSDTMIQNVYLHPPIALTMSTDTFMCNSDTTLIFASVMGGLGTGYQYSWNSGLSDTSHHLVYPLYSKNYTVTVHDACETPPASGSVYITVFPLPPADFTVDINEGCLPLDVEFTELFSNSTGSCNWDFGDTTFSNQCGTVSHTYSTEGCWNVTLTYTDSLNCSRSQHYDSLVCSYASPVTNFNFSPSYASLVDNYISFFNTSSSNATQFLWTLGDSNHAETFNTENFSYLFQDMDLGMYPVCLAASNDFGCTTTYCSTIEFKDDFLIYIPNSFTADGDGRNDEFRPILKGADEFGYKMEIFNRWGELVFESTNQNINWDGVHYKTADMCNPGVYVWRLEVNDIINFKRKEFFGNVTLLR